MKTEATPARYLTSDLVARLEAHKLGRVSHTAKGKPWIVDVAVQFRDERRALAFEKYLRRIARSRSRRQW